MATRTATQPDRVLESPVHVHGRRGESRQHVSEDVAVQTQDRPRALHVRNRASQGGWLSSVEALDHLGLDSLSTLYWHIHQNQLPYGRLGSRYRFKPAALDAWMDRTSPGALALKKVV